MHKFIDCLRSGTAKVALSLCFYHRAIRSRFKADVARSVVTQLRHPVVGVSFEGGGAHSYDKNQAGRQEMHDSGKEMSNLNKDKRKDIEQALKNKGFEPGSVDGVIDSQTQSAISQFQRDNNLPATGTVDEQFSAAHRHRAESIDDLTKCCRSKEAG